MRYDEYITQLGFTDDELKILSIIDETCRESFQKDLSQAREEYDKGDEAFATYLFAFAQKADVPINTLNLYVYLRLMEDTYKEYEKRGIDKSVFIDSMMSFVISSRLPLGNGQPFGLSQPVYRSWLRRNLDCVIYRLGNLEFELLAAPCDMEIDSRSVKKGEICIGVHIPRGVRFDEVTCEDAYTRARVFFKKYYNMDNVIFSCWSWLLYPWLCEVLPETSSIVKFQKKFKLLQVDENNGGIGWIFGISIDGKENQSIENLPEDTSLRRAAKQRLREGKNLGGGLGIRL